MAIAVIAGLGNPGKEYEQTRHNIGFVVIDALAKASRAKWKDEKRFHSKIAKVQWGSSSVILVKPQTYMNDSGRALGALLNFYKIPENELVVIYDEINLEPARLKLAVKGGDGGHNGISSIMSHVGNRFIRYRIGIGSKKHLEMDLKDYVLGRFTAEEQSEIEKRIHDYLNGLRHVHNVGVAKAMNTLNIRPKQEKQNESDSNEEQLPG